MNFIDTMEYLLKKYEVEENKKAGYCFRLAWDYALAGEGLQEVEKHFIALVALIK